MLLMRLGDGAVQLQPDHFLATLYGRQNENDFAKLLDATLLSIAALNADIFSVMTDDGEKQPLFDPTADILDTYKKHKGDWNIYEPAFLDLMKKREIEKRLDPATIQGGCLLCSEDKPHHCHRRLVAEYLKFHWGAINIQHLV